jgi:hypothetical protein
MTTKYIEIDSTYRDRNKFPLSSQFDLVISQTGIKGKKEALDPVCESSPIVIFNTSMIYDTTSLEIKDLEVVSPDVSTLTQSPTDPSKLLMRTTYYLRPETDFYVGCSLGIGTGGFTYEYRRVIAYEYVGFDAGYHYGIFTPNFAYPTTIGTGGYMVNPTPLNTSGLPPPWILPQVSVPADNTPRFWIPGGSLINNYYINYYLYNTLQRQYKKIISYNGETRLATLDSPTSTDWIFNYNYSIRKELPSVEGLTVPLVGNVELSSVTLGFVTSGELSSTVDFYVGDYIRFNLGTYNISPDITQYSPFYQQRVITGYDPATKILSFSPSIFVSQEALDASYPLPNQYLAYEILPFSRDNFSPFNYIGSIVSSQQQVCYEVELVNLVLPNFLLKSSRGGRITFYPYIYVEFHPISDSATNSRGLMWSNNPNSYKMLFRAIITDTQEPILTAFVKISGDGQVKTMKFKPNDSFRFSVYNSDGELFQTVEQDNYSPTAPNPLVQISALFSIRRSEE